MHEHNQDSYDVIIAGGGPVGLFLAVLVRPDGFVAWATDAVPRAEAITEALARWFGNPGIGTDLLP